MGLQALMEVLPQELRTALGYLEQDRLEELRLRAGFAPTVTVGGRERPLPGVCGAVDARMLEDILAAATGHSCYSAEQSLREGFVTLPGGHRIGVCGTAAVQDGTIRALREISSLCIRIAGERRQAPAELLRWLDGPVLILGPPGSGKTTLLRECVRRLSESGSRVSVVDARGEIAACRAGVPQLDVGAHTDVLTGSGKAEGIMLLLRGMNPQWIAVDEITAPEDIAAMEQASYCGVKLLATAHASAPDELQKRPLYRRLCALELFERLLILTPDKRVRMERMA